MLEQFMEVQEATGIHNILTKLESSLDRQKEKHDPIIQFDHAVDAPGQKWLYKLYQLIKQKETTSITYQAFGKRQKNRIISPQLLKEYKGRWYLLSYDHQQDDNRVYALDRIKGVSASLSDYKALDKATSKQYFDQVVGVSVLKDRTIEKVIFEVYGIQIDYFKSKPIHPTQRLVSQSEGAVIFEIKVIINYELVSELMSYHKNLKIISPTDLKTEMRLAVHTMSKYYK